MAARRCVFTAILLAVIPLSTMCAQSVPTPATQAVLPAAQPLSVEDIAKLAQDGISEDVLAARIKKNGKAFDLSSEEIRELKRIGLSDTLVKLLMDPTLPYNPPPPPGPAAPPAPAPRPPRKYPDDPNGSRVPPEPGLYRFDRNAPTPIDIKLFLGQQQGPGVFKVLMKKGRVIAYLVGPAAKTRVATETPVFYMRMAEGKGIEEVLLVTLDRKKDRRELDMGPPAPKPEFKAETIRQFDSLEVGAGVFRLSPLALGKGEYVFFLINTAEPPKGSYGKGYDFGVDPAAVEKKR